MPLRTVTGAAGSTVVVSPTARAERIGGCSIAPGFSGAFFAAPLLSQEVCQLLHELVRIQLALGQSLALLGGRRVILLLELLDVLASRLVPGHLAIALGPELL